MEGERERERVREKERKILPMKTLGPRSHENYVILALDWVLGFRIGNSFYLLLNVCV
jgi:hypothetical protein